MIPSNNNNGQVVNILPLSYGLSLLKQLLPVPTHIFKSDNHYLEKFDNGQHDDWNILKTDFDFRCQLLKEIREKGVVIISNEKPIVYGGVKCNDELTLVVGPVAIVDVDPNFCKLYALKHNAYNLTPFSCSVKKLASILLLIYSSITNEFMYLTDFLDSNLLSDEIVENTNKQIAQIFSHQSVAEKTHNPGMFEDSIKSAIKSGNVDDLKKALNSIYASMRGTLSRNSLRSAKNLAIVDITIATRAAIEVGLSVEEMYVISDAFIMEVEDCKYESDATALSQACALRCTQMVSKFISTRDQSEYNSLVVSRCCQYIERHIYEKFELQKMCDKLNVSASYLSKLFKAEKEKTVGEYVRSRKIQIAQMMLKTTDKPISEIALMLSFNSQSHFGRVFLQETGQTPATYKSKNAIIDSVL